MPEASLVDRRAKSTLRLHNQMAQELGCSLSLKRSSAVPSHSMNSTRIKEVFEEYLLNLSHCLWGDSVSILALF